MFKRIPILAMVLMWVFFFSLAGAAEETEFNFSIDIPEGWWRVKTDKYLVITKDGAFKHYIFIQERPLLLPFKNTGKTLQPTHLPNEVAQIIVDELNADPNLTQLQMIENIPATVAGRPGFQLTFLYTDPLGISLKRYITGVSRESASTICAIRLRRKPILMKKPGGSFQGCAKASISINFFHKIAGRLIAALIFDRLARIRVAHFLGTMRAENGGHIVLVRHCFCGDAHDIVF